VNLQRWIAPSDLSTIGPRLTALHACVRHYTVLCDGCVALSLRLSTENRKPLEAQAVFCSREQPYQMCHRRSCRWEWSCLLLFCSPLSSYSLFSPPFHVFFTVFHPLPSTEFTSLLPVLSVYSSILHLINDKRLYVAITQLDPELTLSSSSLVRQPFVSPGLPQNYSPFFSIVGPSGYSFFGFLNNLIFTARCC
jgi:hypothetical protein